MLSHVIVHLLIPDVRDGPSFPYGDTKHLGKLDLSMFSASVKAVGLQPRFACLLGKGAFTKPELWIKKIKSSQSLFPHKRAVVC